MLTIYIPCEDSDGEATVANLGTMYGNMSRLIATPLPSRSGQMTVHGVTQVPGTAGGRAPRGPAEQVRDADRGGDRP
jgi:hypothetical protein